MATLFFLIVILAVVMIVVGLVYTNNIYTTLTDGLESLHKWFFKTNENIEALSKQITDLCSYVELLKKELTDIKSSVAYLELQKTIANAAQQHPLPTEEGSEAEPGVNIAAAPERLNYGTMSPEVKKTCEDYIVLEYGRRSQREMATWLGVSRSVVRTFIKHLVKEGRINPEQKGGTIEE